MSIMRATNSSIPNIVGIGLMVAGAASGASLLAGGAPILNMQGNEVADFAFAGATAIAGYFVLKEGSAVGAWMSVIVVAGAMTYAGLAVNTDQAGRMFTATVNAAKEGATVAANDVGGQGYHSQASEYRPVRLLTDKESAECDAGLKWTRTEQGRLNCSIASDGKRWVWSSK